MFDSDYFCTVYFNIKTHEYTSKIHRSTNENKRVGTYNHRHIHNFICIKKYLTKHLSTNYSLRDS